MWKILIVDDEDDNSRLLAEILGDRAECKIANSGPKALAAFETACEMKNPYQIILLDVAMPGMDGLEVLERIREYERLHGILLGDGIPVIMVTAHTNTFMKSFNRGCDDFILKPVDGDELLAKIESKFNGSIPAK